MRLRGLKAWGVDRGEEHLAGIEPEALLRKPAENRGSVLVAKGQVVGNHVVSQGRFMKELPLAPDIAIFC
jgi:hypothetical protein